MIVVDSSALIAILEQEAEAERFLETIRDAPRRLISAVTACETGIVLGARRGEQSTADLFAFFETLDLEIVPFAEPYISGALEAYRRYGKGNDPRARLNLGDCASYSLAKTLDVPLLFKGSDFSNTDLSVPA